MSRGEIHRADLDPAVGSEQGEIRPVVMIQHDAETCTALTAAERGLTKDPVILTGQLRTLETSRMTRRP